MTQWKSQNRHKYLLQYHVIFVCKYRKPLLADTTIIADIKFLSQEICGKVGVDIRYMETDRDHIHYMLEASPTVRLSDIIATLKSYTTFWIWKRHPAELRRHFWKERTFWTDGYFICSVGNVSEKMLKEYIENQG